MWRSSFAFLKQAASLSAVRYRPKPPLGSTAAKWTAPFSSDASSGAACGAGVVGGDGNGGISFEEAKKLMRLVNVEALKTKLGVEGKEVIEYSDLLEACESMGVARSRDEAVVFARVLDDAGVVLLFRDRVYLHPDKHRLSVWSRTRNWKREFMKLPSFIFSGFLCTLDPNQFVWDHLRGEFHIRILHQDWDVDKVVELIRRVVPLSLTSEDDPRRNELKQLQEKKEEIDMLAHRQVRRILWSGLGFSILQVGLFFRLTFWEFSWDVMEPITFFTTATGIIIGYGYFLFTSRDPTYQDLMKRLFLSRQRKLIRRHNFDVNRFLELQKICRSPLDGPTLTFAKQKVGVDLEDSLS